MRDKIEALQKEIERQSKELAELKVLANKEEEFKVGDWVEWSGNDPMIGQILAKCEMFNDSWQVKVKGNSCSESYLRKLSVEEIEKHLISEAEKKGFVKGAKVKRSGRDLDYTIDKIHYYPLMREGLRSGATSVYEKEKGSDFLVIENGCATIPLPECTIPSHPIIEIGSRKVEFKDNHIKVGCKDIYSDSILRLHAAIQQWNDKTDGIPIQSFQIQGGIIRTEKLTEIAKHYSK